MSIWQRGGRPGNLCDIANVGNAWHDGVMGGLRRLVSLWASKSQQEAHRLNKNAPSNAWGNACSIA